MCVERYFLKILYANCGSKKSQQNYSTLFQQIPFKQIIMNGNKKIEVSVHWGRDHTKDLPNSSN